jgi:pyroglutamyl-peptidase
MIEQYSGLDLASVKAVPLRILVTGFGKFPGARDNPTALLVHALGGRRGRLARLGVELETDVLPVNYAGVASTLKQLNETLQSNAIQFCEEAREWSGA